VIIPPINCLREGQPESQGEVSSVGCWDIIAIILVVLVIANTIVPYRML
jgi:hypothetical protein